MSIIVDYNCRRCNKMDMLINVAVHTCKMELQLRQKNGKPGIYWNSPNDCNISFMDHKNCFSSLKIRQWFCDEVNRRLEIELRLECVYRDKQSGLCHRGDFEGCLDNPCIPCKDFTICDGPFDKIKEDINIKKCLCGYESPISEWREISVTSSLSTAIYVKSRLVKRKRDEHAELHSCPKCGLVYNTDTNTY